MTSQDIDALFHFVSKATDSQLHSLDESRLEWVPYMRGRSSIRTAVRALRKAVEKCPLRSGRLERLAFFYSWLSPYNLIRPWTLMRYSSSVASQDPDPVALLRRIESSMWLLGRKGTSQRTRTGSSVFACLLVEDNEPEAPAHVVCLGCWRWLPYLVVYAPAEKIHGDLSVVLAAVMDCDPALLTCGTYEDLNDAYTAAVVDGACSINDCPRRMAERRLRDMNEGEPSAAVQREQRRRASTI
ncbi:hypothetical protein HPB50_022190 [Hyalomma asiaticum]|uniref:Uncharacterized protein n=1 Tax=Hyalomma asiaticum TaxID=266040 RepID=A0ACB7RSC8_HYAAI|nr:hypothetical protein HPB50_022190 [Hyalomma asiaticum]